MSDHLSLRGLWLLVSAHALCARSGLNPDTWFPMNAEQTAARREAATALDVCTACLVRASCLELSIRHWSVGQYGIWGGLLPSEREALRSVDISRPAQRGRAAS